MPSPASFPNVNFNGSFWGDAAAPGSGGFLQALRYWQDQLKRNAAGGGLAQLAGAQASDPDAAAYQSQRYVGQGGPGQQAAINAYAGQSGGRVAAKAKEDVANQVQRKDLSGSLAASGGWGGSLTDYLTGQIALNKAQSLSGLQTLGGFEDIFNQFAKLGLLATAPTTGGATLPIAAAFPSGGGAGPFSLGFGPTSTPYGYSAGPFSLLDPNALGSYAALGA